MQRYKLVNLKTLIASNILPDDTEQTAWAMSHNRLIEVFTKYSGDCDITEFALVGDEGRTIICHPSTRTFMVCRGHANGLAPSYGVAWL